MKKQILKNRIIEVAWELFEEKGYEATTMNDIIEKAYRSRAARHYEGEFKLLWLRAITKNSRFRIITIFTGLV